jgi:hypothetical protein
MNLHTKKNSMDNNNKFMDNLSFRLWLETFAGDSIIEFKGKLRNNT